MAAAGGDPAVSELPDWREHCLTQWPSSSALAHVDQPRAWRALALARSSAGNPSLRQAAWQKEDLLPFVVQGVPLLLLLDVFDGDRAIFSGRLLGIEPYDDSGLENGVVADEDDAAEEFLDAHGQLHLSGGAIKAFPRLLLLHAESANTLDACLVRAVEEWNADAGDEEASSGREHALTAQLCVVQADGKVAVLELGDATSDRRVHDHYRDDYRPSYGDERWQEKPSGMLRWARTFSDSSRSGKAGTDCILNVYCVGELVTDAAADEAEPAEIGVEEAPTSGESSDSDGSAGEEAVREAAAEHVEWLRDALRANEAEHEVLSRALADSLEGRTGGAGGHDDDLDDFLYDGDVQASPRRSSSSHTTLSDTSSDGTGSAPTTHMRLALASLSLGWLSVDGTREHMLFHMWRDAVVNGDDDVPFEYDDERERERDLSHEEEEKIEEAEAAEFWAELDAQMPWYRR